jgi:hypothetical protein
MSRRSGWYRVLLLVGTVGGLGGAAYFAWHLLKPSDPGEPIRIGEQAYARGVEALERKDGATASAALDEAVGRANEALRKLEEWQRTGKVKAEDTGHLEVVRGRAYWLLARALRDAAFARRLVAGQPIPERHDTSAREDYRSYWDIPDDQERRTALSALSEALVRIPKEPEVVRDGLRVSLAMDPLPWSDIARLAQSTLEKSPDDTRANYLMARYEFEQFDARGQPAPANLRDLSRVLRARQFLANSQMSGNFPLWRTLDLDIQITRWLLAQPVSPSADFDAIAEAARLRERLFDAKSGALARAAAGEGFDRLSPFDVTGIMNVHRSAVEIAVEDARTVRNALARLQYALSSALGVTRTLSAHPKVTSLTGQMIDGLTEMAAIARPVADRAPAEWAAFAKELDDFCRTQSANKSIHAQSALRLGDLQLAATATASSSAAEKRALDWYEEAIRLPQTPVAIGVDARTRILELKVVHAAPAAECAQHLQALSEAKTPKATVVRALFAATFAERAGRLEEALNLFSLAASAENGGEYSLRAFAALPAIALALGKNADAATFAQELDRGWDLLAPLDRFGKAWIGRYVADRDEAVAILAIAQYRGARQRVERDRKLKPGKTPAPDATRSLERSAETATGRLPNGKLQLAARLAQLEFLAVAGRTEESAKAADALRKDYPEEGASVLRSQMCAAGAEDRQKADPLAREAAVRSPFFWPEWLASSGRVVDAAAELGKLDAPGASTLSQMLKAAEPAEASGLIRAVATAAAQPLTFDRVTYNAVRTGVELFGAGKYEEAAREFDRVAEAASLKAAAASARRGASGGKP